MPTATSSTSTSTKSARRRSSPRSRRSPSPSGCARATTRPCRSWSSATSASSSRWPRNTRTAASRSPTSSAKATSACSPPPGSSIPTRASSSSPTPSGGSARRSSRRSRARAGRCGCRSTARPTSRASCGPPETLRQELRREPTPEEIAHATGLSLDVVQSLAALNTSEVRLDAPLDPEGDRSLIERFIADEQGDPEAQAMDKFLSEEIESALRTLPPPGREGAPPLLRPRRRPRAHPGRDRRHARRHPRARPPAARPRAQATARGRGRPGSSELRGVAIASGCVAPRGLPSRRPGRFRRACGTPQPRDRPCPRRRPHLVAPPRGADAAARRGLGAHRAVHRRLHRHRPLAALLLHLHRRRARSTSSGRWSARRS